jgi:uncharacterized protein (TIGR02466 family)
MNRAQRRKAAKQGDTNPSESNLPNNLPSDALSMARSLHKSGQLQQARSLYAKILQSEPNNPQLLNYFGVLKAQIGDRQEALDLLEKAVRLESNFGYLNNLGNIYRSANRLEDAISCYQKALELNPESADSHLNLGIALTEKGEIVGAIAAFEAALSVNPYHPRAHITLGDLLQSQGELDRAIASYQKAIALQPESFEALTSLGMAFYRKGSLQESQRTYEHALSIDPFSITALSNIAATFYEQGRIDMATACYREVLNIQPQSPDAHINLGFLSGQQGHYPEAEAHYQQALQLEPQSNKAAMGLAELFAAQEQWQKAIPLYEQILQANSDRSDRTNQTTQSFELQEARAHLGIALRAVGDLTGAIAQFEQVLETNPRHIKANAHLGLTYKNFQDERSQLANSIFDWEQLVSCDRLSVPEGWSDLQQFNSQLCDYVYQHPTLLADRAGKPIVKGKQTYEIFTDSTEVMKALKQKIDSSLRNYFARCADLPFFQGINSKWNLSGWAVVLSPQGFQTPHIHPESFCSGVYYIQIPDAIAQTKTHEGYLSFGTLFPHAADDVKLAKYTIAPAEGLLVLFPSYFWHSTIPFSGDSLFPAEMLREQDAFHRDRVCISFNVILDPSL